MSTASVTITVTDSRNGREYVRTYIDTPDFSRSVHEMLAEVMPETHADWVYATIGDGRADATIRDWQSGKRVGTVAVVDADPTGGLS